MTLNRRLTGDGFRDYTSYPDRCSTCGAAVVEAATNQWAHMTSPPKAKDGTHMAIVDPPHTLDATGR